MVGSGEVLVLRWFGIPTVRNTILALSHCEGTMASLLE